MNILSILIVNYRSERQLDACLHSLADCCINLDYEIQIINNDQDGKLSEVWEIDNPRIKIIQNQSNRGFFLLLSIRGIIRAVHLLLCC